MNLLRSAWIALTFLAGANVTYTYFTLGWVALVYPLTFAGWFFLITFGSYVNAAVQASVNPGLEKLREPSFWLSAVGNAYLYVTDRKRWRLYVSLLAFFTGLLLGTPIGFIVVGRAITLDMISSFGAFVSWFAGASLAFSITVTLNTFTSKGKPKVAMQKPGKSGPKRVCPKCGKEMSIDFKICPSCGELLFD